MIVRTSRLELMKRQIELDGLKLYDKEDAMLRKRLQKEAMDEVERQAGILGLSETTRKSLVRGAAEVISGDFHGAPFSSRIWANKNELVARLQVGLERSILQGEHPDRWARLFTDLVSNEMGEKAGRALFAARRLAITESARVMSEIQFNSFERGGYKKYIWITEIDDRTCPVCSAMDGEVFNMDNSEIGANLPPLHPFCRCSIAAYFDEADEKWYNKDEVLGKFGRVVDIEPMNVDWDLPSIHGYRKMEQRGISQQDVESWVSAGVPVEQIAGQKYAFVTKDGVAIIRTDGKLIIAWTKADFDAPMNDIIYRLFREDQ